MLSFILITIGLWAQFYEGFLIGVSSAARKNAEYDFDYEFAFEIVKQDVIYLELEKERQDGKTYYNQELKLTYAPPYFNANAKWLNIESNDIDLKQIDMRGVYSFFSLGIAQQWNSDIPDTKLIAGIKLNVIFHDIDIKLNQDFLTQDFNEWNTDTMCRIGIDISKVTVYWKGDIKNYTDSDWSTKLGIGIKL